MIQLPHEYNVSPSQLFGENPQYYNQLGMAGHNGIDYPLEIGSAVFASDAGKVLWVKYDETGFGLHVKIEHEHGWTLYAHLVCVIVGAEQNVVAGQQIALSGNTGASTGPHLHFGYKPKNYDYYNGYFGYVDPQPYLTESETI